MLCRLPDTPLPVLARRTAKRLAKNWRKTSIAGIRQLPSREFSEIIQCMFQPFAIEIPVKHNCMQVIGHENISIDTQVFIPDAEI